MLELYSVIASTIQGCKSFDTVRIVNVFANPVVFFKLDQSFSMLWDLKNIGCWQLCVDICGMMEAQRKKLWLRKQGSDEVQVTDINGCKGMRFQYYHWLSSNTYSLSSTRYFHLFL